MRVRICLAAIFGLGFAAAGCRDQEHPAPVLNVGVSVGDGTRTLLPTMVPPLKDHASILGAAASAEEVGAARAAAEAAANVVRIDIDATTPENLMKGFVAIIEAGSFAQLADIVVPEQQEAARQLAGAVGPLFQGLKAVETKWKEKFPDSPLPGGFQGPGFDVMKAPKVTEVKELDNGVEAEATIENPQGGDPEKMQLKKIDDAWRVFDPKLQMPGDAEAAKKFLGVFSGIGKALQEFAVRLDNDEFESAEEAGKALDEVGQKAMSGLMADMTAEIGEAMKEAESPPAEAEPSNAEPETLQPAPPGANGAARPKPADDDKPKSQLERDMDSAVGRSAMGGI